MLFSTQTTPVPSGPYLQVGEMRFGELIWTRLVKEA